MKRRLQKEIQERLNVYAKMYSDASMHDEDGDWQNDIWIKYITRLSKNGYAAKIMCAMIDLARQETEKD